MAAVARFALVLWSGGVVVTPQAHALDPHRALTQYGLKQWGPENGLPCYGIHSVVQSGDGYLWLGTEEGVVRFDGLRAKVFDQASNPELGSNDTFVAVEDSLQPGELLIGNSSGLFGLRGNTAHALPAVTAAAADSQSLHQSVRSISQDDVDGTLWVGTLQGLFCVRPDGRILGPDDASGRPKAQTFALCRDGAGRLCVATSQGLYRQRERRWDASFERVSALGQAKINCLAQASDGSLWVGTNTEVGRLRDDTFLPRPELAGRFVQCLHEDSSGMLWVGTTGNGLYRLAAEAPRTAAVLSTAQGLPLGDIRGLCEDREGNLWVATVTGLQMLRDVRFTVVGRAEGLADDMVYSIWEDPAGRLWVGGQQGLSSIEPGRDAHGTPTAAADGDRIVNYPVPELPTRPGNHTIACVGPDEGLSQSDTSGHSGLLAGTEAGGLLHVHDGTVERLHLGDDLDQDIIGALCADKATGNLWVGGHKGIYLVRDKTVVARHSTAGNELPNNYVCALHIDRRGSLWIATDGGLARRDAAGHFTNFALGGGPLAVAADSLYEDPRSGDLFVGTENGLLRVRSQESGEVKITPYTVRDGLFDNKVWSILDDGAGNLWMSSNKGVFRLALADLTRFDRREIASIPTVSYGMADGMRSRECNGGFQPAAWRDHLGQLWFATTKGAACVDPVRALKLNPLPPPVRIEELLADGHPVVLAASGRPPELPAGTRRLDFRYTALSLSAPEANRFRCQLEGFEQGWREVGTERAAHYTNLAPGAYTFRVQAANADGVWNETGASVSFRLLPFFYQTAWFWTASACLVLGLGGAWLRRHKNHLLARLAQAETEVAERARTQEILRQAKEEAEQARVEAEAAQAEAESRPARPRASFSLASPTS